MESKAEKHLRFLSVMQEQLDSDEATEASSQKILEFYSEWMERSNELFWQCVGPDARRLFPEDMAAVVPLSRSADASVVTTVSSTEGHQVKEFARISLQQFLPDRDRHAHECPSA
jgi:hypothetical protein